MILSPIPLQESENGWMVLSCQLGLSRVRTVSKATLPVVSHIRRVVRLPTMQVASVEDNLM